MVKTNLKFSHGIPFNLNFEGTFKCRAGYAHNDEPHMVFKSVICRQKGKPVCII